MLGLFMVMPVLAVLTTDYPGYSPWLVGLAIGGYGLTQACLQIPMGVLSDRLGRKPVIILGLLLFSLGSLIAATADTMWMLVLGRLMQGMGAIAGAVMALAADVSREQQRAKVMAIIGISIGFSFYLSLLLGPPLAGKFGLPGIFYGTCLMALLCIPLVLFAIPSASNHAPSGDTLPNIKSVTALFANAHLAKLNISVLLLHFCITLLFVLLPQLLVGLGVQLDGHWSLYLPVLLASIVAMSVLMRLAKQGRNKQILVVSVALLAVSFSGLAIGASSLVAVLFWLWLFFSGFNYLEANLPAIVSSIAPAGQKGSAMGVYASFQFFGAFVGGLAAGGISQWLGDTALLLIAALVCVIWLVIAANLNLEDKAHRYTLSVDFSAYPQAEVVSRLQTLDGIKDINLIEADNVVYLKVDNSKFQLQQAKALFS